HAFDYNKISGKEINVRYSNPEEEFTTLDGITHKLPEKSVMICDAEKAVALGGIMGGANSEVMDDTTDVLLEAAYFNPGRINKTAKTLRINTEASHRFERGVDPNGIETAMERTASLIQQLTGGKLLKGIVDQYPSPIQPLEIPVDLKMINKIVGIDFTIEQMEKLLKSINIKIEDDKFIIPTFRPDIKISADIAEEVARIYGYDNIPAREITEMNYGIHYNEYDDFIDGLKVDMAGMEMYEVISNSMGKKELFESVTGIESMGIVNPVSRDLTGLRTSLIPSMLEIVKNNVNRQNKDLRLFEINNIYIPSKVKTEPPLQERHLCVAISGRRYPLHWGVNNEPVDFYDIKGITEDILAKISLDNYGLFYYDNFIG
ncbi:MAG: phenylalanine--tRNA ligase subunit beta, partial [Calditrichia bacterium]|nr:phenylalanine--tRNA ligase subunit beta [Calditrichia bacterium]